MKKKSKFSVSTNFITYVGLIFGINLYAAIMLQRTNAITFLILSVFGLTMLIFLLIYAIILDICFYFKIKKFRKWQEKMLNRDDYVAELAERCVPIIYECNEESKKDA